jgi:hypothetical protein
MQNCLSYVICKAYQDYKKYKNPGYILIRLSNFKDDFGITSPWNPFFWVPHFLHRDYKHQITQFIPTIEQRNLNKKQGIFLAWLSLWRFQGIIAGDDERQNNA